MAKKPSVSDDSVVQQVNDNPPIKKYLDPSWTEHVLSYLTKDELAEGKFPTCDGLRRVFEILMGDIISSESHVVSCPSQENPRATVEHTLVYITHDTQKQKTILDAAHVGIENTDPKFARFSVACASTQAEGRALRKGLRLVKVLTREEMVDQANDETTNAVIDQSANSTQKHIITKHVNDLRISFTKLCVKELQKKVEDVSELKYSDAQKLIMLLIKYKDGPDKNGIAIPDDVKEVK